MTKRKLFPLVLVIAGLAVLYPYITSRANARDSGSSAVGADIAFGDPAHKAFFNYQKFLAEQKEKAETPDTWKQLSNVERIQKLKDGEAFLGNLHKELLAKPALTPKEQQLMRAVWGTLQVEATPQNIKYGAIASEDSSAIKKVGVVSEKLEGFQKSKNWDKLFDGGMHSGADAVNAAVASGNGDNPGSKVKFTSKREAEKHKEIGLPPGKKDDTGSGGNTIPLVAVGAGLLASAYFIARFAKKKMADRALASQLEKNGYGVLYGEVISRVGDKGLSLTDVPLRDMAAAGCPLPQCPPGCPMGCERRCPAGCPTSCPRGCSPGCSSGCQSSCPNGCPPGCPNGCEPGCPNGCPDSCTDGCPRGCPNGCPESCPNGCANSDAFPS